MPSLFGFVAELFVISCFFFFLSSASCSAILISFFKVFNLLQKRRITQSCTMVCKRNITLCIISLIQIVDLWKSYLLSQVIIVFIAYSLHYKSSELFFNFHTTLFFESLKQESHQRFVNNGSKLLDIKHLQDQQLYVNVCIWQEKQLLVSTIHTVHV